MQHIERFVVVIAILVLAATLALGNALTPAAPGTVASRRPAPIAARPPIQAPDADTAIHTAGRPQPLRASGRHPRSEEIVRLPPQIQAQVATTVLTPAHLVSPAEILTLPAQIQDHVRPAQQVHTR